MLDNITVNTQSSVRIAAGRQVLYFDPIKIEESPHDADIILLTHNHGDHFDPESIGRISRGPDRTFIVCPVDMRDEVQEKTDTPHNDIISMQPGEAMQLNGFAIEAVHAYNIGKDFHKKEYNWLGFVVTVQGQRIYVSGDMDATPEAKAVRCDIALVPIGGTYTMAPDEAAAYINELKPKTVIPTHYGSIVGTPADADTFAAAVDAGIEVVKKLQF